MRHNGVRSACGCRDGGHGARGHGMRRDGAHRACCCRDAPAAADVTKMAQSLGRCNTRHNTRGAVATERSVVAAARTWREGSLRERKVRRWKTVTRRAPDIVRSWRRSCHGSRRGSAGSGAGGVGAGGLSTVVHGADRTAVRGALEERGEVVVAAAKVISVAATMASAETK